MKKLALVLLLLIGMGLSFSAIGLVMLFATGVVENVDEARALLLGEMPGSQSAFLRAGEVSEEQDALMLLQQQKEELQGDLQRLVDEQKVLVQVRDSLSTEVKDLIQQGESGSEDKSKLRSERLEQLTTLYGAMRPADAAAIMDQMSDQMVLEILPTLDERQAARILNGLANDERKASLSAQLLEGKGGGKQ